MLPGSISEARHVLAKTYGLLTRDFLFLVTDCSQVASFAVLYVIGEPQSSPSKLCHAFLTNEIRTPPQIYLYLGVCISLVGTGFLVGFMTQFKKVHAELREKTSRTFSANLYASLLR